LRILHIIQCTNLAGMERVALSITKGLLERGHQCRWVSLNPLGDLKPLLDQAKVPCLGLPYRGPWGALSLPAMRRAFRSEPRDAVIMTGPNLSAMVALGRHQGEPRMLAVHFHHTGVKPRWQWRAIYRLAVSRFRVITFPSDFIRREAEEIYPPVAAISRTLRNPVAVPPLPSPEQRLAARERLGIPRDVPVIGNAGWLIPRKRFDIFLRVAARVAASIPEAVFLIAGDGPERQPLQRLAQELGIEHRVRWMGWQTDLTDSYLAIDVLLFNSDWDAFPTTPLEAMSYAIPVVASVIHGGLGEVISSPADGFLLGRHDVPALAAQVERYIAAPQPVAMAGRERIHQFLDPEICISETAEALTAAPVSS
jgi:glycosyltransferase involved in cell wall biosynthesis